MISQVVTFLRGGIMEPGTQEKYFVWQAQYKKPKRRMTTFNCFLINFQGRWKFKPAKPSDCNLQLYVTEKVVYGAKENKNLLRSVLF